MLLPCSLTRSEGFSIELFGVQNNFVERKGTCEYQITCDNEHQCCQIINEWEELYMVAQLCGVPLVPCLWCVRIQNFSTSSLSFNILLSHVGKILVLSSLLAHMVDNGTMFIQASIERFKSNEQLPIHLTISMFPLLARVNW